MDDAEERLQPMPEKLYCFARPFPVKTKIHRSIRTILHNCMSGGVGLDRFERTMYM